MATPLDPARQRFTRRLCAVLVVVALVLGARAGWQWHNYQVATELFQKAQHLTCSGQNQAAIPVLEESVSRCPVMVTSWDLLSATYLDLGRVDKALEVSQKAVALVPECALLHQGLGHALAKSRRYREAADSYATAFRLDPQDTLSQRLQERCLRLASTVR